MGEILYGVDFRAKRRVMPQEETLEQLACRLMDVVWRGSDIDDTAPSEYWPSESDPA